MARTEHTLEKGAGAAYNLSIAVLCGTFKREHISRILKDTQKEGQRNRELTGTMLVYYVIAMCLLNTVNLKEVLRCLLDGLRSIFGVDQVKITGKSGISQGRARLGVEPLKRLYEEAVAPIAIPQTKGAFYRSWRIVSLDGSHIEIPDEAENRAAFEKRTVKNYGQTPYPQMRIVSLLENGTHVLFGAVCGPTNIGENTLAYDVILNLKKGMVCLADRLFYGYNLWCAAQDQGADLVWRARSNIHFEVEKKLVDGSFLSRVYSRPGRKNVKNSRVVRVVDYEIQDSSEHYRLITTILNPEDAPADELAALYSERWEIESSFDELKTHLKGARICLRSKTADLIKQEFYGLLLAHFVIRFAIHQAACEANIDPDRLSYTHTLNIIRRKIRILRNFSPSETTEDMD